MLRIQNNSDYDEVHSFLMCCNALDMVVASSRGLVTYQKYEECVLEYFEVHQKVFGDMCWVYKHHMAMHLPDMFRRFGPLSCFVHERKHKLVKRFCKDHVCKKRPEKSLMLQLIAQHSHDLSEFCVSAQLISPVAANKKLLEVIRHLRPETKDAFSSITAANKDWGLVGRGDVALMGPEYGHSIGIVYFHVDCDPGTSAASGPMVLLAMHKPDKIAADGKSSSYNVDDDVPPVLVPAASVKCATIHRRIGDRLTVLWPIEYQLLFPQS